VNEQPVKQSSLLDAVHDALTKVVFTDKVVLELSAHELALVHRFGVYMEERLQEPLRRHGLSVDLDYDRHGFTHKFLPRRSDREGDKRFRPDLVIHRRTDDSANLLVVEWKKSADDETVEQLERRLQSLMQTDREFADYGYDVGVIVDSDDKGVRWRAFDRLGPLDGWQLISNH
jgi:hypothetical protein